MTDMRIRQVLSERPAPNWWLRVGVPMVAIFAFGFLLRVAFDFASTPSWLVWWGYGGLGLVGLVLTGVGMTKALRGRADGRSDAE